MSGVLCTRREFVSRGAVLGGGLLLGFHLPACALFGRRGALPPHLEPNAFLRIGSDESVTVIVGKAEMGQGVYTALPMLLAEELEVDWRSVGYAAAPVAPAYHHTAFGIQMTGGSSSVWSSFDQLRQVGAAARTLLVAAAAETWGVPAESCSARQGSVVHGPSGRQFSYGQVAERAAMMPPPGPVPLKEPGEFRLLGKPTLRLDSAEKVSGRAVFGLDVRRPGMLTALVARPPAFGTTAKGFDPARALAVAGVRTVVKVPSGVAVVGDGFWAAKQGRDALAVDWTPAPGEELSTPDLRRRYAALAGSPGTVVRQEGNPAEALAAAHRRVEAVYDLPFLAHAPMEPLNCTVALQTDRCEIWTGTQFQTVDRAAAARAAGLPPERVELHTTFLGGGFGRRANPASDFVVEAVEVAKAVGAPVQVVWTREDDIRGGYYRPMSHNVLAAGLDAAGAPVAWTHRIVGQSILAGTSFERVLVKDGVDGTSVEGAAGLPYRIPNLRVDLHSPHLPVPVLWWRSVGHSIHAFVVESFLDEMAHAAGRDPLEYRLQLLPTGARQRRVLELAADAAGWGQPPPAGIGRGLAVHESFGSFVAEVAEVSIERGKVRVHRVVCAVDCGLVVNPLTVEAQIQGGIAFGLTAALYGELTLDRGRVTQGNFDDYPVLRLPEMPRVEVHIVPSTAAPGGIGEPGTPPIAAAVANAVFALNGKRIRRLPLDLDG